MVNLQFFLFASFFTFIIQLQFYSFFPLLWRESDFLQRSLLIQAKLQIKLTFSLISNLFSNRNTAYTACYQYYKLDNFYFYWAIASFSCRSTSCIDINALFFLCRRDICRSSMVFEKSFSPISCDNSIHKFRFTWLKYADFHEVNLVGSLVAGPATDASRKQMTNQIVQVTWPERRAWRTRYCLSGNSSS